MWLNDAAHPASLSTGDRRTIAYVPSTRLAEGE